MDRLSKSAWKCVLLTLILQQITLPVESYKILMVHPSFSKSHLIISSALAKGLAEVGHEVSGFNYKAFVILYIPPLSSL